MVLMDPILMVNLETKNGLTLQSLNITQIIIILSVTMICGVTGMGICGLAL
jgi:hypothetical protein